MFVFFVVVVFSIVVIILCIVYYFIFLSFCCHFVVQIETFQMRLAILLKFSAKMHDFSVS